MSRKANIQCISSCYVMPMTANMDDRVHVTDTSVQAINPDGGPKLSYHFNTVYKNQHDYAKSAYNTSLAPIVRQAIAGESCLAVFGGVQSSKLSSYLLSQTAMQGLISQAASQLLHSVNLSEDKSGSVTFSWYKIDCAMPEVVTDVLKAASSTAQGLVSNSKTSAETASLVLREAGKGRGMIVPGLWEVEIANGADVEAVINHVIKTIPDVADHTGTSHSVMVLTVKNPTAAGAKAHQSAQKPVGSQLEGSADGAGIGRLAFVLLASLHAPSAAPTSGSGGGGGGGGGHLPALYPWVDQVHTISAWLTARRPSPPFHKSRLLLLLRDALLRRQSLSCMLLLSPSADQYPASLHWLRLAAALASAGPGEDRGLAPGAGGGGGGQRSLSTPRAKPPPPPPSTTAPSAANGSGRGTPQPRGASLRAQSADDASLDFSPLPRPPPPLTTRGGSVGTSSTHPSAPPGQRAVRSNSYTSAADNLSAATPGPDGHYADDLLARETEAALSIALEASRSEASALRIAYAYANDKHAELKALYDQLVEQLREEGSMLTRRDKERYKSAMKDLRDYEIYKQVMEAAMVRMQAELEAYAKENQELKQAKACEERNAHKHRAAAEKQAKELAALAKRVADLEPRLAAEERKSKQIGRERDAAVAALAQSQGQLGQKLAQMTETLALRQKEVEDLHKRSKHFEERCRALEAEKEALLASHAAESTGLRNAHSKALETLMTYQEENDMLRAAVMEVTGKDFPRAVQTARKDSIESANGESSSRHSSIASQASKKPPL